MLSPRVFMYVISTTSIFTIILFMLAANPQFWKKPISAIIRDPDLLQDLHFLNNAMALRILLSLVSILIFAYKVRLIRDSTGIKRALVQLAKLATIGCLGFIVLENEWLSKRLEVNEVSLWTIIIVNGLLLIFVMYVYATPLL